jgi:hypothetical protein
MARVRAAASPSRKIRETEMSELYIEKCARVLVAKLRDEYLTRDSYEDLPDTWARVARAVLEAGRLSENDDAVWSLVDGGAGDLYKGDENDCEQARSWLREAEDAALGEEGTQPCPGSCALWWSNAGEEGVHRCAACDAPFESKDLTSDGFVPQHVRARPPE